MGEMPSDNSFDEVPANDGGRYGQLDEFTTVTNNQVITGIWKESYRAIQRTNTVLNRINGVVFREEQTRLARMGEMQFLRALFYFNLVRIYGDVPLVIKETEDPFAYFGQGRMDQKLVYDQILQDLEDAIENLPSTSTEPGRAIKTSAQTLLGKVLLTLNNFPAAKAPLDEVVQSGRHRLLADIENVFSVDHENNDEIIFAIQFAAGINGNSMGSRAFQQFSPSGNISGAKGHNLPTRELYQSYADQDKRKSIYLGITEEGIPFSKKMAFPTTEPADGESDFVVLRYADVLLMLAEIENELGNSEKAKDYLDLVRKRAGLDITKAETKMELAQAIEQERRWELISEGHRWFDLLRTGRAVETMNNWFSGEGINIRIDENDLLMPIPQSQIDTDPSITQNPGY